MTPPKRGLVHQYTNRLTAFEHTPSSAATEPQNLLLFVGGLFDGLLTVPYTSKIAEALPPTWTLAQAHLSSSYTGWGTSSLGRDVKELSKCIKYFRGIKSGKIVLMGHSTGCQDVLFYVTGQGHETRTPIDGGIIQAAVSDREAILMGMDPEEYKKVCSTAQEMTASGTGDHILNSRSIQPIFPCPVSSRRWLSLASPNKDGEDDMFSSDLTEEQLMKTFGSLPAAFPLCILNSGSDEYMPTEINKEALVKKWIEVSKKGKGVINEEFSGIVEGASHNLASSKEEVVQELVRRVTGFLGSLSSQANL